MYNMYIKNDITTILIYFIARTVSPHRVLNFAIRKTLRTYDIIPLFGFYVNPHKQTTEICLSLKVNSRFCLKLEFSLGMKFQQSGR